MAEDDRRMHENDTPGLVPGRGHERHEGRVTAADAIRADDDNSPPDGPVGDVNAVGDGQDQDSALGGEVATQSGTGPGALAIAAMCSRRGGSPEFRALRCLALGSRLRGSTTFNSSPARGRWHA